MPFPNMECIENLSGLSITFQNKETQYKQIRKNMTKSFDKKATVLANISPHRNFS